MARPDRHVSDERKTPTSALEYLRWLRQKQRDTAETIASSQRALEESLELLNRFDASAGAAHVPTPRPR